MSWHINKLNDSIKSGRGDAKRLFPGVYLIDHSMKTTSSITKRFMKTNKLMKMA